MIRVLALASRNLPFVDYRVMLPVGCVEQRASEYDLRITTVEKLGGELAPTSLSTSTLPRVTRVDVPRNVHVLVMQQPPNATTVGAIVWLRANRPKLGIVVDITHRPQDPELDRLTRRAAALADVVTCRTPILADRYTFDENRTFVIRDAVSAAQLNNPARALSRKKNHTELNRDRVIGWAGCAVRSVEDFEVMQGALQDIVGADRTDGRRVRLRVIGSREGVQEALSVNPLDIEASGILPNDLYHVALGECDVAVVPYADRTSAYTRALEFAAAGVPVIASKTPEHEELQKQGMPLWLVRGKRREWTRAIRSVLDFDDDELRDLAHQHRENVRSVHTIEKRAPEWVRAWKTASRQSEDE